MKQLVPFQSDDMLRLKIVVQQLQKTLLDSDEEFNQYQSMIEAFNNEYKLRLGDLIEAVVNLRQQFNIRENSSKQVVTELNKDDKIKLKQCYKKACKLCHPDILKPEQRKLGAEIFDRLHKFYKQQDLLQVEHILFSLQTGTYFGKTLQMVNRYDLLLQKQKLLEQSITQSKDKIAILKNSDEYDLTNRDNWNIQLYALQTELEDELAELRRK